MERLPPSARRRRRRRGGHYTPLCGCVCIIYVYSSPRYLIVHKSNRRFSFIMLFYIQFISTGLLQPVVGYPADVGRTGRQRPVTTRSLTHRSLILSLPLSPSRVKDRRVCTCASIRAGRSVSVRCTCSQKTEKLRRETNRAGKEYVGTEKSRCGEEIRNQNRFLTLHTSDDPASLPLIYCGECIVTSVYLEKPLWCSVDDSQLITFNTSVLLLCLLLTVARRLNE